MLGEFYVSQPADRKIAGAGKLILQLVERHEDCENLYLMALQNAWTGSPIFSMVLQGSCPRSWQLSR